MKKRRISNAICRQMCSSVMIIAPLSMAATLAPAMGPELLEPTEGPIAKRGPISGYKADSARNHSVNSYWVSAPEGLVIIDTQWRLSDAERAVKYLKKSEDAPVAAIFITHPHSDHFGGLPVFFDASDGKAKVIAARPTVRSMAHDEQGFRANRLDDFGKDFPVKLPTVNHVIDSDDERVEIAGALFQVVTYRGNEAPASSVIYFKSERALFTGDLVNSQTIPVLYQGDLDGWISQLGQLKHRFPKAKKIYPGHGRPGLASELIEEEIAYLVLFRDLLEAALYEDGTVSDDDRTLIREALIKEFPRWRTSAGLLSRDQLINQNITWALRGWRVKKAGADDTGEFRVRNE